MKENNIFFEISNVVFFFTMVNIFTKTNIFKNFSQTSNIFWESQFFFCKKAQNQKRKHFSKLWTTFLKCEHLKKSGAKLTNSNNFRNINIFSKHEYLMKFSQFYFKLWTNYENMIFWIVKKLWKHEHFTLKMIMNNFGKIRTFYVIFGTFLQFVDKYWKHGFFELWTIF